MLEKDAGAGARQKDRAGTAERVIWVRQGFRVDKDDPADTASRKADTRRGRRHGFPDRAVCAGSSAAPSSHQLDRPRGRAARVDQAAAGHRNRAAQPGRRRGPTGNHPQLGEQRTRAARDGLHPDRRAPGHGQRAAHARLGDVPSAIHATSVSVPTRQEWPRASVTRLTGTPSSLVMPTHGRQVRPGKCRTGRSGRNARQAYTDGRQRRVGDNELGGPALRSRSATAAGLRPVRKYLLPLQLCGRDASVMIRPWHGGMTQRGIA
jgi:hypothetical protein